MIDTILQQVGLARQPQRDIWQFQRAVSVRLLAWAVANIATGVWLQQRRDKFWRGVGMQSLSWGAINALIAIIGSAVAAVRRGRLPNPNARPVVEREHRNLFRALWINGVLDVFYVIGGVLLIFTRGKRDRLMRGNGWGVVLQGAFLFVFDFLHAAIMVANRDRASQ